MMRMNDLAYMGEARLLLENAEDGERRKLSWLRLLEGQIGKYTHGGSSSVPLETAGSLMRSILYTAALAQNGISESGKKPADLYREGRDILFRQFKKAQRLTYLVQSTMLAIDSPCYREAVETGIPAFFRAYDMEFAAQETPGDFDYPASLPNMNTGVAWMLPFLETLYWENVFCRRFPASEVEGTLKANGVLSIAIPVNVFEPVFAAAIHGYLVNRGKSSSLIIRAADNSRIVQELAPLSKGDVMERVKEAYEKMMEDMEIKSGSFRKLLMYQADALARRLAAALKHGDVDGVFPPWFSPPPPVLMMDGDVMGDEEFRVLQAELVSCRYFSDKLMLIRRRTHSLYDLTGLMESGCFSLGEMSRLYSMLGTEELAALLRMGRGGLFFEGRWVFKDTGAPLAEAPLWEKCLYGYLGNLGPVRCKEITGIAGYMQLST
jgi:hypothetical protein